MSFAAFSPPGFLHSAGPILNLNCIYGRRVKLEARRSHPAFPRVRSIKPSNSAGRPCRRPSAAGSTVLANGNILWEVRVQAAHLPTPGPRLAVLRLLHGRLDTKFAGEMAFYETHLALWRR